LNHGRRIVAIKIFVIDIKVIQSKSKLRTKNFFFFRFKFSGIWTIPNYCF